MENPSAFCLLSSAFCLLLPSAFCLLPSAFCLLRSAFCLLPSDWASGAHQEPLAAGRLGTNCRTA